MKNIAVSLSVAALATLAACASSETPRGSAPGAAAGSADSPGGAKLAQAATTPLSDLNLVRADIPPVLAAAQKAPYATPALVSCEALAGEVQAIDAALGADLDVPSTAANPSLIERGGSAAGDAAVGAVRGAAEGVVPFRGWIRKLTGAERYAREVAAAIAAGGIRRAYLKGLGQAAGCTAPAAPRSK